MFHSSNEIPIIQHNNQLSKLITIDTFVHLPIGVHFQRYEMKEIIEHQQFEYHRNYNSEIMVHREIMKYTDTVRGIC